MGATGIGGTILSKTLNMPERIQQLFEDGRVIDVHVNVGFKIGQQCVDGDPDGEHVLRQYSPEDLRDSNLVKIGLRTHYSRLELPAVEDDRLVPSVAINWLGVSPEAIEEELDRFSHPNPIIWFQSFRDPFHRKVIDDKYRRAVVAGGEESLTVTHTDNFGHLTESTLAVLEIARDKRAIIATPHSNWERTVPLILHAVEMGLNVLWVHPDSRLIKTPLSIQQALTQGGAGRVFVERAMVFLRDGKPGAYSAKRTVSDVRAIGKEHIIFSSDLGRHKPKDLLLPDEGLRWYMEQLTAAGLTVEEAEMGLVINPLRLLGGEKT